MNIQHRACDEGNRNDAQNSTHETNVGGDRPRALQHKTPTYHAKLFERQHKYAGNINGECNPQRLRITRNMRQRQKNREHNHHHEAVGRAKQT